MTKSKLGLSESAAELELTHAKLTNSRRDLKMKRTIFMKAQLANQANEVEFKRLSDLHEQRLIEVV